MSKKKKNTVEDTDKSFDPELLRAYMMGATNPGFSNKIESADDVIDLHVEQHRIGKGKIPVEDVLFHQLEEFERALDRAIASGKLEFSVVHGLGKGKLKEEIHKLLDKHPTVKRYSNDYSSSHGYGSTTIYFY